LLTPLQRVSRTFFLTSLLLFAGEFALLFLFDADGQEFVTVDLVRTGLSLPLLGLTWGVSEMFWRFGMLAVCVAVLYAVALVVGGIFVLTEPGGIAQGLSKYGPILAFFTLLTGFGLAGTLLFRSALRTYQRRPGGFQV
jgi:hypothetical protein